MIFTLRDIEYSIHQKAILRLGDLRVQSGQHLLLLGASGSGKTTLLNLMAGLLPLQKGEITYNNEHHYSSLPPARMDDLRARHFGFIFQRLHLIGHLTALQNISLAQATKDAAYIASLMGDLNIADKQQQKARSLSVGEAQRVAIARALANRPRVIFADEPTSALDDANTDAVIDLLLAQAHKAGATLIVATHDARIKPRFDHILELGT